MDFSERIAELSKKVKNLGDSLKTEEATKNALVMPFIAALGYDVFNPAEVVPEFQPPSASIKTPAWTMRFLLTASLSFFWNARLWARLLT